MNVVMNNGGAFIEVQGTAEGHAFRRHELDRAAGPGVRRLPAALRGTARGAAGRRDPERSAGTRPRDQDVACAAGPRDRQRRQAARAAGDPRAVARRGAAPVRIHAAPRPRRPAQSFVGERNPQGALRRAGGRTAGDRRRFGARSRRARRCAGRLLGTFRRSRVPDDAANNARLLRELAGVPDGGPRRALSLCDGVRRRGRTIRRRSSAQAAGKAGSRRLPAAAAVSATTRCSSSPERSGPPPNSQPGEKNRVSHRGQALRALVAALGGEERAW